jgi:transposase-like protein
MVFGAVNSSRPATSDSAPDQERQIRALYDAGEGVAALIATFGVSRATVYRLLAERPAA